MATPPAKTHQNQPTQPVSSVFLPCSPFTAARIAGLRATIGLLLILLIKSKLLRIKMSLVGSLLGLLMVLGFLATTGLLTAVAAGSIAYGLRPRS